MLIQQLYLYISGVFNHFVYELLNNNFIIGLITPINESIFEHTKLVIIPYISYHIYQYIKNKNFKIKELCLSLYISFFVMTALYYTYRGIIGKDITILNIIIYFITIFITELMTKHIMKYSKKDNKVIYIIMIIIYFVLIVYLTINPIKIPFMKDPINNTYGIYRLK